MKNNKIFNRIIFVIIFIAVTVVGMHVWINILSNQVVQDQKSLDAINSSSNSVITSKVSDDIQYYKKSIKEKQSEIDLLHKIGFR